jgi:hypothetical protein
MEDRDGFALIGVVGVFEATDGFSGDGARKFGRDLEGVRVPEERVVEPDGLVVVRGEDGWGIRDICH